MALELTTDRLVLRPLDHDRHFDAFAAMAADDEVVRWLAARAMDRASAWRVFAGILGHVAIRGYGFMAVEERDTGAFVGRIGPWFPEGWPAREVGWSVARPFWGRGYAGEAAAACLDYVFDALGWDAVTHQIAPDNIRSQRVAEKLGSVKQHENVPLLGLGQDLRVDVWGQTAAAWRGRRG